MSPRLRYFLRRLLERLLRFRSTAIGWIAFLVWGIPSLSAETVLHLFAGGASQRPDLVRAVLDDYEAKNPGIRIVVRTGAATSELQRRYLSTLLNARDSTFDALLIDIVAPPQFAAAGWIEPLDSYFGEDTEAIFADFLPIYRTVNRHRDRWIAIPFDTSAPFLYYRRDLLEKYNLPVPETWAQLADAVQPRMHTNRHEWKTGGKCHAWRSHHSGSGDAGIVQDDNPLVIRVISCPFVVSN